MRCDIDDDDFRQYELSQNSSLPPRIWLGSTEPLVVRFKVKNLFGRYSYDLYAPNGENPRLMLIYGGNGSGKTHVLRILWHMMSSAPDKHHRTTLSETPFEGARIYLSNGHSIILDKNGRLKGPYSIAIIGPERGRISSWPEKAHLWPNDAAPKDTALRERIEQERLRYEEQQYYLDYLNTVSRSPILLADDRTIYSDEIEPTPKKTTFSFNDNARKADSVPEESQSQVSRESSVAIRRASTHFTNLALGGTESGSAGANTVYLEVLHRLTETGLSSDVEVDQFRELLDFVEEVGQRNRPFAQIGLVPAFHPNLYKEALLRLPDPNSFRIADQVIRPFLYSLMARLDALQGPQQTIQTFLDEVNGFLTDKAMYFTPAEGLQLRSVDGDDLNTAKLSSGERQLILLMCNALLSGSDSVMFLIDEPELSLNVRWQRKLVSALLNCTAGTPVQFILATHSIELLSRYRTNVVRLENVDDLELW